MGSKFFAYVHLCALWFHFFFVHFFSIKYYHFSDQLVLIAFVQLGSCESMNNDRSLYFCCGYSLSCFKKEKKEGEQPKQ